MESVDRIGKFEIVSYDRNVFQKYRKFIEKMFLDNMYREDTYVSYISYLRNFENYILSIKRHLTYIYQIDRTIVLSFLEYIYVERNNTPQTRDNYLTFLRVLSTWLVQNQYMNKNRQKAWQCSEKDRKRNKEQLYRKLTSEDFMIFWSRKINTIYSLAI